MSERDYYHGITREEWTSWVEIENARIREERKQEQYNRWYALMAQWRPSAERQAQYVGPFNQIAMIHGTCPTCGRTADHAGLGHFIGGILGL